MTMTIRRIVALAFSVFAVACVDAQAAVPALLNVGQQDRHSTWTFSAPGADDATVYVATKPDRGTDGRFLEEIVEGYVFLTDDEIAAGSWLGSEPARPRQLPRDAAGRQLRLPRRSGVLGRLLERPAAHGPEAGAEVLAQGDALVRDALSEADDLASQRGSALSNSGEAVTGSACLI
jgi:hypothetical protein